MPSAQPTVPLAQLSPGYHPRRDEEFIWEIGRGRVWLTGLGVVLFLWLVVPAFFNWKHVISASGGRYFLHRTVIPVPAFQQGDPRWADQLLGTTIDTMGQSGCAVTSAAMILAAYGVDTDPERLNTYLTTHGGYVGDGWLVWEKAADAAGGQVQKAYEDLPSYALIDANILKGNPVIIRLTLHRGENHFVVIVGKKGWHYLIRDPARPADYGVYPLSQLTSRIEALRYYKVVPAAPVTPKAAPLAGAPPPASSLAAPTTALPPTSSAIGAPASVTAPAASSAR